MSKSLVIVESPCKGQGRSINIWVRIMWSEASIGHIMDLPKNDIGVELKRRTFQPTLIVSPGKEKVVAQLEKAGGQGGQGVPGAGPGSRRRGDRGAPCRCSLSRC